MTHVSIQYTGAIPQQLWDSPELITKTEIENHLLKIHYGIKNDVIFAVTTDLPNQVVKGVKFDLKNIRLTL